MLHIPVFSVTCSDEDTDIKAVVTSWLSSQPESEQHILSGWIEDHFYKAVDWVLKQVRFKSFILTLFNPTRKIMLEQYLFFKRK